MQPQQSAISHSSKSKGCTAPRKHLHAQRRSNTRKIKDRENRRARHVEVANPPRTIMNASVSESQPQMESPPDLKQRAMDTFQSTSGASRGSYMPQAEMIRGPQPNSIVPANSSTIRATGVSLLVTHGLTICSDFTMLLSITAFKQMCLCLPANSTPKLLSSGPHLLPLRKLRASLLVLILPSSSHRTCQHRIPFPCLCPLSPLCWLVSCCARHHYPYCLLLVLRHSWLSCCRPLVCTRRLPARRGHSHLLGFRCLLALQVGPSCHV